VSGAVERKEFVQHYGIYAEITYLLCTTYNYTHNEVWSWDIDKFLFQGEYLIRKRIVENIK
jgi:hypothetical protein